MMIRRRSSGTKQDDGQVKTTRSKQKELKSKKNTTKRKLSGSEEEKVKKPVRESPRTNAKPVRESPRTNTRKVTKQEQVKQPVKDSPCTNVKKGKLVKTKEKSAIVERKTPKNKTASPKLKTPKKELKKMGKANNSSKEKAMDSDNGYAADKESQSSQTSDLYDFENSEENFASPPITSSQQKRKQASSTSSNKRRKVALNNSTNIQKHATKDQKKTGLNVSKGTLRTQAMKKCLKRSMDSGVFMTPSPVLEKMAKFNDSISSKPTSTPTGVIAPTKADKHLGAPLLAPPDLSPVKRLQSPNSGGLHGNVLTSPEISDASPAITAIDAQESEIAEPVEVESSILDISKTYKDCSFPTLDKKRGKGKKSGKKSAKKQNRYSTSKYEVWADKKATEFEEIEQFELSIE